jgi:hypothetical protein
MLGGYGASFLDARGKLVARSYDILGGVEFFFFLEGQTWCNDESCLTESLGHGFKAASPHLRGGDLSCFILSWDLTHVWASGNESALFYRILTFAALDCKVPVYSMFQLVFAGLYSAFVFQKPDPDAIPPIVTPDLPDPDKGHEEVWSISSVLSS